MHIKDYPRLGGLLIFTMSASISVWYYNATLKSATSHSEKYIGVSHAFMGCVAIASLGLSMMLFGEKVIDYSKGLKGRKKNTKDFIIFGLILLPAILATALLNHQLSLLGYE